jgi:hypothetical protein
MLITASATAQDARARTLKPGSTEGPAPLRASRRRQRENSRFSRARLIEDAGFTLIELALSSLVAIVVLSATLALLESGQQVQARDSEWALALQEDRTGLARMVGDIRQATKVEAAEAKSGSVVFLATVEGKRWKIKYDCTVSQPGTSYSECVRLAAEVGNPLPSSGPAVARDLIDPNEVFSYSPNATEPKAVTARLELPARGALKQAGSTGYSHKVVLEDAAFMRNLYLEG